MYLTEQLHRHELVPISHSVAMSPEARLWIALGFHLLPCGEQGELKRLYSSCLLWHSAVLSASGVSALASQRRPRLSVQRMR